jgi:hypothetical protein
MADDKICWPTPLAFSPVTSALILRRFMAQLLSADLVSRVTDAVLRRYLDLGKQALEPMYSIVFLPHCSQTARGKPSGQQGLRFCVNRRANARFGLWIANK